MFIQNEFEIEETVYLKTDKDLNPRIVIKLLIAHNNISYCLACGAQESWHYSFEISREKCFIV
jgi:hypothetical protein